MGGKASKDTQGVGLVPRDGTDEIEVLPKKLVTQEQFDELLHKFSLLEQLMQQDKSKISDLETSVDLFQKDKQQYRQSFTDIDNEVKRDKEDREKLEKSLADQVEQRTRDKYLILDQMLTSQAERIDNLIKEQETNSDRLKAEYGQLDRKLTTSLQVERDEVERLVQTKITEENKGKGELEKRVSKLFDQNTISVSTVQDQLDDRKRETQEVRESVQREKDALMEEIGRVQAVLQEAKQTSESEQKLSEQLIATKEQLEVRLSREEQARLHMGTLMKTMVDNKVSENQKQFLEQIKAHEELIQAQERRMELLKGDMDSAAKEEQERVRLEVEDKMSEMSITYERQLSVKEVEKKEITRKLSQDFENRLQEVQSSFSKDIQEHRSKTDTILEDSDLDKKTVQTRLDAMEETFMHKLEEYSRDSELVSFGEELKSSAARSQRSDIEIAGMREQLTEVKGDLSVVRDSQTEIRDDLELMQNKLSNETDAKIQLIIEAKISEVSTELNEKYNSSAESYAVLAEKLDALGTSSDPKQEPLQLEYMQKTNEEIGILLDRLSETGSQLQSVSESIMEVERKQEVSQTDTQSNQGQIQTAQSDLLVLRSENAELTQKYELQSNELARVVSENAKLQQSMDSVVRSLEEQSKEFATLKSQIGSNKLSVSDVPPESPLEKMEEMETVIKKQGHGINDLEFLIDQAKDIARTSAEEVDSAIHKFDSKLEEETARLRSELESLRTEMTKKISEAVTNQNPVPSAN